MTSSALEQAQERGIVGETPNLAARLQGLAEPNSVVIGESTRKLLGNLFELEEPTRTQGHRGACSRLDCATTEPGGKPVRCPARGGLTELVGRKRSLSCCCDAGRRERPAEGQAVLLSGEAGIGKSRLTAALLERVAGEPHTRLRYFCSPRHTNSAFFPIINQMERAAGFAHHASPKEKLDKLDALLTQSFTSSQDTALFAEMLSLPNDGRYPSVEPAPQQRRLKTLEALTTQLQALSRASPVLMIFEDLQWIDPTSLEALDIAVDRIGKLSALLIATYRPEAHERWLGRPNVTALTLNRFGARKVPQ